ncbi:MAG: hypothetical protein U9Q62_00080 [Campylobacterota bacterium]|nr:hypothetical protein [Campylobacterota bacterium]
MAKKKRAIELSDKNIEYDTEEGRVKVIRFNPNNQSVDVNLYVKEEKVKSVSIAFAHLPKPIKKLVRPL